MALRPLARNMGFHALSLLAGSLATALILALPIFTSAQARMMDPEYRSNCPEAAAKTEPGTAPELPRDWVWRRQAVRFGEMFRR